METYTFYVKDKKVQVMPKRELTGAETNKLKEKGFKKHHIEVEAMSKKDAIVKLNENTDENLEALRNYAGDYLFSSVFIMLILGWVWYKM